VGRVVVIERETEIDRWRERERERESEKERGREREILREIHSILIPMPLLCRH